MGLNLELRKDNTAHMDTLMKPLILLLRRFVQPIRNIR